MTARDPQSAALLAHVVSQVEANVQFLVSQNYISQSDASTFLAKLPNGASPAPSTGFLGKIMPRVTARKSSGPPVVQARALWPYNEGNAEPNDLSFSAGDIIEIVEETNNDWWTGKINGKQALFPSAYVEKLSTPGPVSPPASGRSMPPVLSPGANTRNAPKPAYKPFGAAYQGVDAPPPAGYGANSVGLQQDPGQEQKKSKYSKYGDTMAHSAAAGVGAGAGMAIGGGLVRAIF